MNIILFDESELVHANQVKLTQARHLEHLHRVYNESGDQLFDVGLINGLMGKGKLIFLSEQEAILDIHLNTPPPAALPLRVIMALPRPKMLKRSLQHLATLGVKSIYLINSYRVEKSFWSTPWLEESCIQEQLQLGIEQARDTVMPEVHLRKRFKPFIEDELRTLCDDSTMLVAHPYTNQKCPSNIDYPVSLLVGPEGGFIPYEIELLENHGVKTVSLGERILRVETVIPYLVGRLFCNV